jgi:hypothetical protein
LNLLTFIALYYSIRSFLLDDCSLSYANIYNG